jgi:hypothetical protein
MGHSAAMRQDRQGDAHTIWVGPDGVPVGLRDKRTPDSKASAAQGLTSDGSRR